MNKIKQRRDVGAICPKCKSPDYKYNDRANSEFTDDGKHQFECNSCGKTWQYGKSESVYTKFI